MEIDNERDRYAYGYDAGLIVDGVVIFNDELKRHVLVDDEGVMFDVQASLSSMVGKTVRVTLIPFESMQKLADMVKNSNKTSVIVPSDD
jgi:hypothetical protein